MKSTIELVVCIFIPHREEKIDAIINFILSVFPDFNNKHIDNNNSDIDIEVNINITSITENKEEVEKSLQK